MFGSLGMPELIVIFVIALIVFGPKRLPEIGKSVGKAMAELKKSTDEFKSSMEAEMKDVKDATDVKKAVGDLGGDSPYPGDATGGAPRPDRLEQNTGEKREEGGT